MTREQQKINCPIVGAQVILFAYGILLFLPKDNWSVEWAYGFCFISKIARWAYFSLMTIFLLFLPQISDGILKILNNALKFFCKFKPWMGVVLAGIIFWFLRSKTIYGDGYGTIYNLTQGEHFNWKEPLDRFFTSSVYQLAGPFGLSPQNAIAWVSVGAGLVWVAWVIRFVRGEYTAVLERLLSAGILLTPGIMQLFCGNIENYSLLAAGVLVYLVESLRYLRGKSHYGVPCFILGLVACVHLSAAWLLPTLAMLLLNAPTGARFSLKGKYKNLAQGVCALMAPFAFTLMLGIYSVGSVYDLNFKTFGGGDGKCWKPLFVTDGPFEKFALISWAHVLALGNQLLLIAGVSFLLLPFLWWIAGRQKKIFSPQNLFLGSCLLFAIAYIVIFNPDMAGGRPGILNEWDLFSLPAVPAVVWVAHLIFSMPTTPQRNRLALQAVGLSLISTFVWVLWNAQKVG